MPSVVVHNCTYIQSNPIISDAGLYDTYYIVSSIPRYQLIPVTHNIFSSVLTTPVHNDKNIRLHELMKEMNYIVVLLTHCGRVTQICVYVLQLCEDG